jgi:hypothetical protein
MLTRADEINLQQRNRTNIPSFLETIHDSFAQPLSGCGMSTLRYSPANSKPINIGSTKHQKFIKFFL